MEVRASLISFSFVLTTLFSSLLPRIYANVVRDGPSNLTVNPGPEAWAEFTCTVQCTHTIDWFVEGYPGNIGTTCTRTLNGMRVCSEVATSCTLPTSDYTYTERLRVLASPELAGSRVAVQCGAVSRSFDTTSCLPFLSYSRFALLSVNSPPPTTAAPTTEAPTTEAPTTEAPPTTEQLPTPSPVVCPSATPEVTTVTETVTSIVILTSTPVPGVDISAFSRAERTTSHFASVVTELLSWAFTLLAGLVLL